MSNTRGKTVKVQITFDSGKTITLEGDDAEKWGEAVDSQSILCAVHGVSFPELNWIEDEVE